MDTYHCPYCNAQLNIDGYVVLSWQSEDKDNGVVLLSDKLGDYTVKFGSKANVKDGMRLNIFCPACHESLQYTGNKNLIRINRCNEFNDHSTILFSAILGEHSTFEISDERTLTYGENAIRYMDPNWYQKLQEGD
jgi:uncharacterized protein YbaR (Trm112 family)